MSSEVLTSAQALAEQIVAWRRDIHMHPEPGFQEHRTAQLVAEALAEMGLRVDTGVGKTGVVGQIGSGRPAIGIRADMDALELQEANEVPYASQIPGMMHACGHDAHTAMLLGAAKLLQEMEDRPAGQIRLLFQPSEESWDEDDKGGARRMVEDGALGGLDAVIALHVDSDTESGLVGVRGGYVMAGVDPYDAVVFGRGCHSAAPHQGVNPIFLLAQVINAIQSISALHIDPLKPAIISCESVHGGSTTGVIPDRVSLHGNIRSYDDESRLRMRDELEGALGVVRSLGGDYELRVRSIYPATYNDPQVTALVRRVATDLVGPEGVYEPERSMAGEDFGYMAREVPGAFVRLGVRLKGEDRPHHSPVFDVDEAALPIGSAVLAETAIRFLAESSVKSG